MYLFFNKIIQHYVYRSNTWVFYRRPYPSPNIMLKANLKNQSWKTLVKD